MKRALGYGSRVVARTPDWELKQVLNSEEAHQGDLVILYRADLVRVLLILQQMPAEEDWEELDAWVLGQVDLAERPYQIDYHEGQFVTGVEGAPGDEYE